MGSAYSIYITPLTASCQLLLALCSHIQKKLCKKPGAAAWIALAGWSYVTAQQHLQTQTSSRFSGNGLGHVCSHLKQIGIIIEDVIKGN